MLGSYAVPDENWSPLVLPDNVTAALSNLAPKLLTPKSSIKNTEDTALIMVAKGKSCLAVNAARIDFYNRPRQIILVYRK